MYKLYVVDLLEQFQFLKRLVEKLEVKEVTYNGSRETERNSGRCGQLHKRLLRLMDWKATRDEVNQDLLLKKRLKWIRC